MIESRLRCLTRACLADLDPPNDLVFFLRMENRTPSRMPAEVTRPVA